MSMTGTPATANDPKKDLEEARGELAAIKVDLQGELQDVRARQRSALERMFRVADGKRIERVKKALEALFTGRV